MRIRKRFVVATVAALAVLGLVFAAAATLTVSSPTLGAGDAVVASCDPDGVTVNYSTIYNDGGYYAVNAVEVSGIDAGCIGETLQVTVGSASAALADGTVTVAGATEMVSLNNEPAAETVHHVAVVMG
jgi:hypothetical protein